MIDSQLEVQMKENAEVIFGQRKELPPGHRERFEQRLKLNRLRQGERFVKRLQTCKAGDDVEQDKPVLKKVRAKATDKSGKAVSVKTWIISSAATAAIITGLVFLLNPFAVKSQSIDIVELYFYYNLQLEEQAAFTRHLIQQVDEANRAILFANVEYIENEPIPDVHLTDNEFALLVACFFEKKIETLQNIQDLILSTESTIN